MHEEMRHAVWRQIDYCALNYISTYVLLVRVFFMYLLIYISATIFHVVCSFSWWYAQVLVILESKLVVITIIYDHLDNVVVNALTCIFLLVCI